MAEAFGRERGVFGQLASGGDAGTFFAIPHRRRDPARRLSARLVVLGREDMARSEQLAARSTVAWHARRHEPARAPGALTAELDDVA